MPIESAFHREAFGGVQWGWDQEMQALQVELTHTLIRAIMAGFGAKHHKIPKPLEVPRPKPVLPAVPKRKASVREMMEILGPVLGGQNG